MLKGNMMREKVACHALKGGEKAFNDDGNVVKGDGEVLHSDGDALMCDGDALNGLLLQKAH